MCLTAREESASPPVHLLLARVGSGSTEEGHERVVCVTAVFDKYTKLQNTAFTFFKQNRDNYLLHFHLESHDRCEVKLKPLLWDQGVYFRPALLIDGVLRLVPHFLPIALREGATLKRPLSPAAPVLAATSSPRPQRRRIEPIDFSRLPPVAELNAQYAATTQGEEIIEEDETAEREELEKEQAKPKFAASRNTMTNPRGGFQHYDHGIFISRALKPLPKDATQAKWDIEFAAAQQRYADRNLDGVVPTITGHRRRNCNRAAHIEMMAGTFGMVALKPCRNCVEAGETCRVYHSECYEWTVEGQNTLNYLGWRCQRCRSKGGLALPPGGCNAQYQA